MANNSNFVRTVLVAALTSQLAVASDFPNPANVHDISNGSTPKNTVRVIKADQPYNADQNIMDFTYHVEQRNDKTYFYATMKAKIEIGTSGTNVYTMMGF